jgi:putative MFS transporter
MQEIIERAIRIGQGIPRLIAFWLGAVAVAIGVGFHMPMFLDARSMNYSLAGMPMDGMMLTGMGLIVTGTLLAGYGLLPGPAIADEPNREAPNWETIVSGTSQTGGTERLTPAHWGMMATMMIALVIDVMKPASLGFVVPGMAKEYGLSRPVVAMLPFFALTGTMLGSYLWGVLADMLGRRAAILLAAIMFIGTSICGAMPSFAWNVVMCFLMGLSAGGMLPVAYTLLAETVPAKHRGWFLVLLGATGLAGGYLAASGCATLLEPIFGWRIMWFLGLPTGLLLIVLNRFIPESPRFLLLHRRAAEAHRVLARFQASLPDMHTSVPLALQVGASSHHGTVLARHPFAGTTASLNVAALAWGLVNFGLILWLPADLRAEGYSVGGSDSLLAQSALLALPTAVITAWLYARWSTKRTLILLCVLTAIGLCGISLLGSGLPATGAFSIALITVLMIGSNGVIAVLLPYSAESYPMQIRGKGTGMVAGSSKLGGVVAQIISMAAVVPALTMAAVVLAIPVIASAAMLGRYGTETRGRRLEEFDRQLH